MFFVILYFCEELGISLTDQLILVNKIFKLLTLYGLSVSQSVTQYLKAYKALVHIVSIM